jgi:hypothetical protein
MDLAPMGGSPEPHAKGRVKRTGFLLHVDSRFPGNDEYGKASHVCP